MLPSQCRWIEWEPGYVTVDWLYGCVGSIRQKEGYFETRVQWQQHVHYGKAASMRQGKRFLARWLSARKGFPGHVTRNPIRGWRPTEAETHEALYRPRASSPYRPARY
jgi:hypothetical protein